MRRRGVTLVELAVAMGVGGLLLAAVLAVRRSGARQVVQLEAETELVRTALVLRAHLAADLAGGLEPAVLTPDEAALGAEPHELVLARFAGYDGQATPAREYAAVRYRWAPGQGVSRQGRALGGMGLDEVRFEADPDGGVRVTLRGDERPGRALTLRFAPAGDPGWIRAPHHVGARRGGFGEP